MKKQKPNQEDCGAYTDHFGSSVPFFPSVFLILFLILQLNSARACTPLAVPSLLNQNIFAGNLQLNWQSNNIWTCDGYSVEVEMVCNTGSFSGMGLFFYSPGLSKVSNPQPYSLQIIPIVSLCPGSIYLFRAREVYGGISSGWTPTFTFAVPGGSVAPSLNVTTDQSILCPPNFAHLHAGINNSCGGPFTYSWSPPTGLDDPGIASPTASVNTTTSYSVVVSGGQLGCWTASGAVTVSTNLDPPAVGSASANPSVICVNLPTVLLLSSFTGNIQWQAASSGAGPWTDIPGAVSSSYTTAPLLQNTCYQAVVSTCIGTVTSNAFCVSVNQVPLLTPSVVQLSCADSIATANMGNPGSSGLPVTVAWSPAPLTLSSQSTIATYTAPGLVTLTVSFADGCQAGTSFTLTPPPPLPQFTITNASGSSSLTCAYPTETLTAANTYTYGSLAYFWSSSSFTAATPAITLTNPSGYTCTVTDPLTHCSVTHSTTVYLNKTPPTSTVGPLTQVITCGPGVVATATGVALSPTTNVTHSWLAPCAPGLVTSGGPTSLFNLGICGSNGTNTFVLTDNINGCSVTKTVEVVSSGGGYPSFDVFDNMTGSTNFTLGCSTKSITDITIQHASAGAGVVNYTVLPPSYPGGNAYTVGPANIYTTTVPGTYTVIVRNMANQCETQISVSVIQNTFSPAVTADAPTLTLSCTTPSVILTGNSSNSPVSYAWSFQNGANPNVVADYSVTVNTSTAGASVPSATLLNTYTFTVRDDNNFCTSHTVIPVYQDTRPPLAQIAGNIPLTCGTASVNLTNNSQTGILPNTFLRFGAINGLLWEGPSPQQPQPNSTSYQAFVAGIYTLTAQDSNNGCTSQTTAVIGDNRIYPVVNVSKTYSLDCGNNSLTITASYIPTVGLVYQWNVIPGSVQGSLNLPVLLTDSPGEYQIVATNPTNGCRTASLVTVLSGTLTGAFQADDTTGFSPFTVHFTNSSYSSLNSASITSIWSYGNGTTATTTVNIPTSATYSQPGSYTVTLFTAKGSCRDTSRQVIHVEIPSRLEVPNVFTPNGDNSNDIFFVKTAGLAEISATVFDRWGNKVYDLTTDAGNIAWDGKNAAGKELAAGTYFYAIKATGNDGRHYTANGPVSLIR